MLSTLYKTKTPEASVWDGEYYTLLLSNPNQGRGYVLTEKHGWWDDTKKSAVNNTTTLSPEEGFATFEEGLAAFNRQKLHRARERFVHCFSPDPERGPGAHDYTLIEI